MGTASSSFASRVAAGGLILAVAASWVAIDPRSIDGFTAPKLLLVEAGLSLAALGALWEGLGRERERLLPRAGRPLAAFFLLLAAGAGAILSALFSTRPGQSLDALRIASVFLLAVPLGASGSFERHRPKILGVFLLCAALNAILVLLAALKIYSPVAVVGEFENAALGGLVGNPGHLSIGLSLAAVAALPGLTAAGAARRLAAGTLILLAAAGMLATQTLTGLLAALAGIIAFAVMRLRRRAWPLVAFVPVLILAAVLVRPVRWRLSQMSEAARRGDWNRVLTARGAPWLAAVEMIREHPLRGIGIGNFGSEFVPARLSAEARRHRRLVLPGMRTNSFSQAHNDYLDLAAAIGLPFATLTLGGLFLVAAGLIRRSAGSLEAAGAAAVLAAGAVAALTWFPLQIPVSALWLLLALGRGFRLMGERC